MQNKYYDLEGMQFGWWTVLQRAPKREGKKEERRYICQCKCGRTKTVASSSLRYGKTKSCKWCEHLRHPDWNYYHKPPDPTRKVNGKNSKAYDCWKAIKQRCYNQNCKEYQWYGARGITICNEWKDNYSAFYEHVSSLEHYGEEKRTLDRIDNNKGYQPGNVRWATPKEQNNNRRKRKSKYGTEEEKRQHALEYEREWQRRYREKKKAEATKKSNQ